MEDLVCIQTYRTRPEAEIAKGFLESNGIIATVLAHDMGGAYPYPFQSSPEGVKLLVSKKDEKKAREVLNTYIKEIIDIKKGQV
jgi:hypothetical protein